MELGTRNIKLALRRLRRFARQGAATELDLPDTIRATANNAGMLDLKLVPERHNTVKVLLFLDIGGSMDDHVGVCERAVLGRPRRNSSIWNISTSTTAPMSGCGRTTGAATMNRCPTWEVLRTYGPDWKLIFVGDATMSPYEIIMPGGSVEHWNEESGRCWMRAPDLRIPPGGMAEPDRRAGLGTVRSTMMRQLMEGRMFPLTRTGSMR